MGAVRLRADDGLSERIRELFDGISPHYDFMNHFLSMGTDKSWRRAAAIAAVMPKSEYSVLDVATGTADLAIEVYKQAAARGKTVSITGMDFSNKMLEIASKKVSALHISCISLESGDALRMKYPDASFDVVTTAFSLRNFDDLGAFVAEVHRVLKSDGRFVFLEMAAPDSGAQRAFFSLYSVLMRAAGRLVRRGAYTWLVSSIKRFDKARLMRMLTDAGFRNVERRNLVSGIAFIATGEKP